MVIIQVLVQLVAVVFVMVAIASLVCIGPERLRRTRTELRPRFVVAAPYLVLLVAVLALNSATRRSMQQISWLIAWNLTGWIYSVERNFVSVLQSWLYSPEATVYFSFIYLFGYAFLLVFPLVAYFALETQEPLQEVTAAYAANYGIGLICYLFVVAFGPRNIGVADQLMYDLYPQAQLITTAVNVNTNVFPSLHTSLSATVMLFAWRTREAYPLWLPIATVIGLSVIVSTMYLGIHWAIDVLAGLVLAVVSVKLGVEIVGRRIGGFPVGRKVSRWYADR